MIGRDLICDRRRCFSCQGFTLIEVMVVTGILAVVASVAVPNLLRTRIQANESSAQTTLRTISTALEGYYTINSRYPSAPSDLLGDVPPYLNKDYFAGSNNGYTFFATLSDYTYAVTAIPVGTQGGTASYTVSTGGVLTKN